MKYAKYVQLQTLLRYKLFQVRVIRSYFDNNLYDLELCGLSLHEEIFASNSNPDHQIYEQNDSPDYRLW